MTIRGETAKFKKERTIRIGDDIQQALADFIEWKQKKRQSVSHSSPLFVSQKGGHLTRQALFEIVKRIFKKARLDQSPHCLRKTGGTIYYIESDYDLIATQHFLGHADPGTTRRYIGLTTNQIVEYAERLSDHLFSAIHAGKVGAEGLRWLSHRIAPREEFDTIVQMSHFTVQDAIRFLNQQGFEVALTMKEEREPKKIVAGSKVIALPRRE